MTQNPPKSIHKLSQEVVNQICAGEVIHRPLNVVKELLENSIDAGATQISVTLENGGLKTITIQDNGSGIRKDDLAIVCNRFTTSKLSTFDDLRSLSTFGFRGEALSSISTVSHLSIQSKTSDSVCGYKAEYFDGNLKSGDDGNLKPVAMNQGTIIIVENLFFNMPTRKQALLSETTEFALVLDMMERYALLHSGKVSLSLKKTSDSIPVVNTKNTTCLEENVCHIFGEQIAKKLLHAMVEDQKLGFEAMLYFTSSDLNLKRAYFILFINDRLVDSSMLKNSIGELYRKYLMKGGNSFVLIFLKINPQNIDVNVHPNKNEVCFLYEDEILDKILHSIEKRLTDRSSSNVSHHAISQPRSISPTFLSRSSSKGSLIMATKTLDSTKASNKTSEHTFIQPKLPFSISKIASTTLNSSSSKNRSQKKQIRNDSHMRRMEQYFKSVPNKGHVKRREFSYDSLNVLRNEVYEARDENVLNMFKNSTFVGGIDENHFLIQYELNLMMINFVNVNVELFYQLYLYDFGNFASIQFRKPLSLERLVGLYFQQNCPDLPDKNQKVCDIVTSLCSKAEMFEDYFSLKINPETKCLESLPRLVVDHLPLMGLLPDFLYHLCTNISYEDETKCFQQIGMEIAKFYSKNNSKNDMNLLLEHRLYPLYKEILYPSTSLTGNETLITLTNTSNLYKVFERC